MISVIRAIVGGLIVATLALVSLPINAHEEFSPTSPPSKAEWQHFHKMSDGQLTRLWKFHAENGGLSLSQWSWQWRMGWLQRCETKALPKICPGILTAGLLDSAMVVRAEAAARIGNRYQKPRPPWEPTGAANKEEKSERKSMIKALARAYVDPRNSRHGSPLFVCDRILEALHKIGDKDAITAAHKLSQSHPETKIYWAKIHK